MTMGDAEVIVYVLNEVAEVVVALGIIAFVARVIWSLIDS